MKRVCVLLLLMATGLLLVACSSQAGDLQEGWYAKIEGVAADYELEPYGNTHTFNVEFSTVPGCQQPG